MAMMTQKLMDAPKVAQLMMDMLVLEDQLLILILVLFVYQLEEVYLVTKEVENLCEEMGLNMIWKSEMITIQILVMDVVKLESLKKVMYVMEEPYQAMILAHFALLKENLQTTTKIHEKSNVEIE